jgi:dTMP kinase
MTDQQAMPRRGIFLTLEGGEGTGKSTLARSLAAAFEQQGYEVVLTREPGGSPHAEELRGAVLAGAAKEFGPFAEAAMFHAARADHLDKLIRPALDRGAIVICDRFADSTRAYQGIAGRLDRTLIRAMERVVVGNDMPDLTLVLDIPAEAGLARAKARMSAAEKPDRFEAEAIGFHRRLRQAYLDIAASEPVRCVIINAAETAEDVAQLAADAVMTRLGDRLAQLAADRAVNTAKAKSTRTTAKAKGSPKGQAT